MSVIAGHTPPGSTDVDYIATVKGAPETIRTMVCSACLSTDCFCFLMFQYYWHRRMNEGKEFCRNNKYMQSFICSDIKMHTFIKTCIYSYMHIHTNIYRYIQSRMSVSHPGAWCQIDGSLSHVTHWQKVFSVWIVVMFALKPRYSSMQGWQLGTVALTELCKKWVIIALAYQAFNSQFNADYVDFIKSLQHIAW